MLPSARQLVLVLRCQASKRKYADNPNFKRLDRLKKIEFFNPELKFPLHIPIKHRYVYSPVKRFHIPPSKNIDFNRLSGNELLLAMEDLGKLKKEEILIALERLAEQPGQESNINLI